MKRVFEYTFERVSMRLEDEGGCHRGGPPGWWGEE